MTKKLLEFVSFVTALCVLMSIMPFAAYAEDGGLEYSEDFSVIYFSPETEIEPSCSINTNKFYSNGAETDATKYFYNQLTANQKMIYDTVWAAGPVEQVRVNISMSSMSAAQQDIMSALTALTEDNPLFFWMSGFGFARASSYIIISVNLDTTHFKDFNDVAAKQAAVIEKLSTIKVNGISRHEKLKSIHDYLANNIVYDDTIAEPNIFDSYGALVNGVCVCEGYAEAFKLLCDREGIPCITVIGTGNGGAHKWNMVQMEDGDWYTIDATWDDQTNYIYYSYFLIGNGTKAPFFSNNTVADSTVHIPTGKLFTNANTALSYPALSGDTYGVGVLRYGAKDVHFDTARGVVMVGKNVSSYVLYITNNTASGFTRTRNGSGTTTSTLTVSDSTTTKEYLVAMRGDIDASNTVNSTDYNILTQVCSANYAVEDNSAKFYAGDINQDGAIDGFDAIAHELYTNGDLVFD